MGIVRFALRLPHTFYVLAVLVIFLGVVTVRSMPIDIFPEIDIPVVTIIWQYTGLSTPEMEQRARRNPVPGLLSNVATIKRDSVQTNANQANVQPVYEVYANADGRDLGSISSDINKIISEYPKQLSPGNRIEVTSQIASMNGAFRDLAIGILFAAVFVYLLMVVNYQTWGDPFVVILALPATFCGIITMLYIHSPSRARQGSIRPSTSRGADQRQNY
jgi:multidrug efflux pump subunit AcrB